MFIELKNQCILTTTLKTEEIGKYDKIENIHTIDYSSHKSNKLLNQKDLMQFKQLLKNMYIEL
jgi:hypothetical protein